MRRMTNLTLPANLVLPDGTTINILPGPPQPGGTQGIPVSRNINGCPIFPADYYCNSPIDKLPLDYRSAQKIAALGIGRLGPSPEMVLNIVGSSVPGANIDWPDTSGETDSGTYPILPTSQVSRYVFGQTSYLKDFTTFDEDGHILSLNPVTGNLYETYGASNNTEPYKLSLGVIWNMYDYRLRTATKLVPYGVDSSGLTSADAAGMPIWPFVLTHEEVYSGQPIIHGVRMGLRQDQVTYGYKWPATHAAGGTSGSGIMLGETFRVRADFTDPTFPDWFQPTLTALKTYGLYFTDNTGFPGLFSTDADQGWGDPNLAASDNWKFATELHKIPFTALEVVDNQPRIINLFSGQVNTNPIPR